MGQLLNIEGIPVQVQRKKVKHIHLRVKPPHGTVTVSAPISMSDGELERFIRSKLSWLQKHVTKYESIPPQEPEQYMSGETLYVFGKPYALRTVHGGKAAMTLSADQAVLTLRNGSTANGRAAFVRGWQREQLKAEITRRLPHWERVTGLHAADWQIKAMTTRWGTCNTATKKLWFSLHLAQKPLPCLDYIIVHELTHLAERKHNARFYALLDDFLPTWREAKDTLNRPPADMPEPAKDQQ